MLESWCLHEFPTAICWQPRSYENIVLPIDCWGGLSTRAATPVMSSVGNHQHFAFIDSAIELVGQPAIEGLE